MNKLLHFFSIALLTQIVLMLSQLVLLPLQIRTWGHLMTAQWYEAAALATITTMVDFGLRSAGHTELLLHVKGKEAKSDAGDYFAQVWSWIRILMIVITTVLIVVQAAYSTFQQHQAYPLWKIGLILAYALETLLVIRITYLDTLGFYRGAEMSYFIFAALRLLLSIPAILVFHFGALGLASLFLVTSLLGVGIQGVLLCANLNSLKLFSGFPKSLSWKVLMLARLTVAEPLASWVRLNLPIVILSTIAPPAAVTTFVGLRAAFGATRTTIQQLARVASVEYLRFRSEGRTKQAGTVILVLILIASLVGTSAAVAIITDNMRLLGLWLTKIDRGLYQTVEIAFVLSAPFYAYQIPLNVMFRVGELVWVARRHYCYAAYASLFAIVAIGVGDFRLYLGILGASEIALSFTFMLAGKADRTKFPAAAPRGLAFCIGGSFLTLILWLALRTNLLPFLLTSSPLAATKTTVLGLVTLATLIICFYITNPKIVQMVRLLIDSRTEATGLSVD